MHFLPQLKQKITAMGVGGCGTHYLRIFTPHMQTHQGSLWWWLGQTLDSPATKKSRRPVLFVFIIHSNTQFSHLNATVEFWWNMHTKDTSATVGSFVCTTDDKRECQTHTVCSQVSDACTSHNNSIAFVHIIICLEARLQILDSLYGMFWRCSCVQL